MINLLIPSPLLSIQKREPFNMGGIYETTPSSTNWALLLAILITHPVQAGDKYSLKTRIQGWISAVNEGNYELCLTFVAPHMFTGHKGLSRRITSNGDVRLSFSGDTLQPLSEYEIKKIEFLENGYQTRVTIDAGVIYQRKPLYVKIDGTSGDYDALVYPATITQRWILINGKWFITSMFRLQYLGSS